MSVITSVNISIGMTTAALRDFINYKRYRFYLMRAFVDILKSICTLPKLVRNGIRKGVSFLSSAFTAVGWLEIFTRLILVGGVS